MPDHFEDAKDNILYRTDGNGGPSTRDLLTAMGALAQDMDDAIKTLKVDLTEQHQETTDWFKEHIKYADKRDERIEKLEMKFNRYERDCPHRVEEAIADAVQRSSAAHAETHAAYVASIGQKRREGDPEGEDWRKQREESRQVWFMWMVGSKVSYIITAVAVALLTLILSQVIAGHP